jgi:uridine kinase
MKKDPAEPAACPLVIAISGTSGAGKTALIGRVAALLPNAVTVTFDDFTASHEMLPTREAWFAGGCDPAGWRNAPLAQHLRSLKRSTCLPVPGQTSLSLVRVILLEEPFGRARPELRDLIDYVVVVEAPAEIALARVLLRFFDDKLRQENPDAFVALLQEHLTLYLQAYRCISATLLAHSLADCDLVLDGTLPLDVLAQQLVHALYQRFPALQ